VEPGTNLKICFILKDYSAEEWLWLIGPALLEKKSMKKNPVKFKESKITKEKNIRIKFLLNRFCNCVPSK
jgi:hypothetical protein